jgi:UDP-N-acetylglucosamine acyltransferase
MPQVHASAIVDSAAELADDVQIGPFSIVGPGVRIGPGTQIGSHVVLVGRTTMGRNNRVFPYCSIGSDPQDKKYAGEATELQIGDGNTFREYCLINTGTAQGGGVTRIGAQNWVMGYAHVAHDCLVGNHTIIANGVQLAGHVNVGDWAIIGGTSAVHQFVRVGAHTMTGGGTILLQDLPPFLMCNGNPAQSHGVHVEGLKRRNFSAAAVTAMRRAYRIVYRDGLPLAEARTALDAFIAEVAAARATHGDGGEAGEAAAGPGADSTGVLQQFAEFLAVTGRGIVR